MNILAQFLARLQKKRKKKLKSDHPELIGVFDALWAKQQSCLAEPQNVETIFLGSSHVDYAYNPEYFSKEGFNLGSNSQGLCNSYQLYDFYSRKLPNLKTILLGVSVFTSGYYLAMTSRNFICDLMHTLYGFTYPGYSHSENNIDVCQERQKHDKPKPSINGFLSPPPIPRDLTTVEERIAGHLRENKRQPDQLRYVDLMLNMAQNCGQRLIFVLMPARDDYRAALPSSKNLFQPFFYYMDRYADLTLLDYYSTDFFSYHDFYDFDHLNTLGAQKFTQKLKEDFYD